MGCSSTGKIKTIKCICSAAPSKTVAASDPCQTNEVLLRVVCISAKFECSLCISTTEKVLCLRACLAQNVECPPEDLVLLCRGKNLSSRLNSSLASFGLAVGGAYKLLVIRRPVTPAWLRITAHVLCSSLPPMHLHMHASSPAVNVKRELRELLRIPALCLSLHLADGEPLPDGASLRDLGVRDGERVYCRIHTEDPPPAAAVDAGRVREQIRRAEGSAEGGGAGSKGARSGVAPGAFLGMRRGFLSGRAEAESGPEQDSDIRAGDRASSESR